MSYKITFSPDPRNPQNEFLSGDNEEEYRVISIQLSENGNLESGESHSAYLERRDDGFYELLLFDLEKKCFEIYRVFSDTYDPKAVCDEVEQLFEECLLQVHLREDDDTPLLIRAKRKPSIRF